MRVLLASRNAKKLMELQRILQPLVPGVQVLGLNDVEEYEEIPETGATFAQNALLKAREGAKHTGLVTVADDSGLAVDALNGMPGIFSARWAGRHGDDEANNDLLLAQLADVPDERLGARFVCAAALVAPGSEHVETGEMPGRLIRAQAGEGGFGYDPIFVPDQQPDPARPARTSAQLSAAEKDGISHRGQAMRALAPQIAGALRP